MNSQARLNVIRALANRAQQEQEYQEEWEDSIKPSTVTGNGVIKQLGSKPLASDRILTNTASGTGPIAAVQTAGGIVGDWVPRFEREEEVQTVKKEKFAYSAIFTREVPGGRTQWTDLEMPQRDPTFFDTNQWDWTFNSAQALKDAFNDEIFYYWNGSSVQELFTHTRAELIASGSISWVNTSLNILSSSITRPGAFETGTPPDPDAVTNLFDGITNYDYFYYIVVIDGQALNTSQAFRLRGANGWNINVRRPSFVTINGTLYSYVFLTADIIDWLNATGPWTIDVRMANTGSANWEIYKVARHGAYFTTTKQGTSFVHITCGFNGDSQTRIRYYSGTGVNPSVLSLTSLNQSQAELYWESEPEETRLSYPDYDWRSFFLTTPSDELNLISDISFYFSGLIDSLAVQGESITNLTKNWVRYGSTSLPSNLDTINALFVNTDGVEFLNNTQITIDYFDPVSGAADITIGDDAGLIFPSINLNSLGTEGVDYFLEDICIPDDSLTQQSGTNWYYPFLGIVPYTVRRTR